LDQIRCARTAFHTYAAFRIDRHDDKRIPIEDGFGLPECSFRVRICEGSVDSGLVARSEWLSQEFQRRLRETNLLRKRLQGKRRLASTNSTHSEEHTDGGEYFFEFISRMPPNGAGLVHAGPLPMRISRIPAPQRSVLFPATSRGVKMCVSLLLCPLRTAISRSSDFFEAATRGVSLRKQ